MQHYKDVIYQPKCYIEEIISYIPLATLKMKAKFKFLISNQLDRFLHCITRMYHLYDDIEGVSSTNSFVSRSYVALVSKPRRKVPCPNSVFL